MVTKLELESGAAKGLAENLVTHANAENRKLAQNSLGVFNRVPREELDLLTRTRTEWFLRAFRQMDSPPPLDEICSIYNLSMP